MIIIKTNLKKKPETCSKCKWCFKKTMMGKDFVCLITRKRLSLTDKGKVEHYGFPCPIEEVAYLTYPMPF